MHTPTHTHARYFSMTPQESQHLPTCKRGRAATPPFFPLNSFPPSKAFCQCQVTLLHFVTYNYSRKAPGYESISMEVGIPYFRLIDLDTKTAAGSLDIGICSLVIS